LRGKILSAPGAAIPGAGNAGALHQKSGVSTGEEKSSMTLKKKKKKKEEKKKNISTTLRKFPSQSGRGDEEGDC